jgi:preprotein translocase subunit YajC
MQTTLLQMQGGGGAAGWMNIVFLVGIMIVFYFFIILPPMRKQKKDAAFRASLKKGDRIVTISGVYGKIVTAEEATLLVEVDENVKIRLERAAVREYQPGQAPQA